MITSISDFMNRFQREGQAIAALRHPNIVQVYDFQVSSSDDDGPMAYMVMDYIEGQTLADYIWRTSYAHNFPTNEEIVRLFTPISLAIDYAHRQRMIHRDIKPANILLDTRNTVHNVMGEPILTDFGIVKVPENNAIAHAATISLLDCTQLTNPPGHLTHVALHLNGIVKAPGAPAQQIQLAARVNSDLNPLRAWMQQLRTDALQLAQMDDVHLGQARALRNDMVV